MVVLRTGSLEACLLLDNPILKLNDLTPKVHIALSGVLHLSLPLVLALDHVINSYMQVIQHRVEGVHFVHHGFELITAEVSKSFSTLS
jgi:hypothetical protein